MKNYSSNIAFNAHNMGWLNEQTMLIKHQAKWAHITLSVCYRWNYDVYVRRFAFCMVAISRSKETRTDVSRFMHEVDSFSMFTFGRHGPSVGKSCFIIWKAPYLGSFFFDTHHDDKNTFVCIRSPYIFTGSCLHSTLCDSRSGNN